jgi:hypothetical protein
VDATAGFQARFSWDKSLTPQTHLGRYARAQAAGPRAEKLAAILDGVERNHSILSTGTGEVKNGHVVTHEYSGDYNEGFIFWNSSTPSLDLIAGQKDVAEAMDALVKAASGSTERERLGYLAGHVGFLVPYTEAWVLAQKIQAVLKDAAEAKKAGNADAARDKVRAEAVPAWLKLAAEVRRVMLIYQGIVATRNDLGQLASMHNKFVRLALHRLPLSIAEYLGEIPPEMDRAVADATRVNPAAPARLIVPTRPSMLGKGESVRVVLIAAGVDNPGEVALHVRPRGASEWKTVPAKLAGRRTYEATLGPFDGAPLMEYYASAMIGSRRVTAPVEAPRDTYWLTLA